MKKQFLLLLTLLVFFVTGAWAQDFEVEFSSNTASDWLKTFESTYTLSASSSSFSASGDHYYNNSPSGSAGNADASYFGVSATTAIEKVQFLVAPNSSSVLSAVFAAFDATPVANMVCASKIITGTTTTNTYAGAEWHEFDLSEVNYDITHVRLYKNFSSNVFYYKSDNSLVPRPSSAQTCRVFGVKVWLKTASPKISASNASITATESGVEVTQNIAVTGTNLTGSTLTAELSPAIPGLSVTLGSSTITAGSISTTATLHYTQTENASGNTTLTFSDGTTSKNVTVTYNASVVSWTLQSISEETTWDFSKITRNTESSLHSNSGIKLTAESTPSISEEIVYENYAGGNLWTIASGFDGTSIAFTGEYPTRNNNICQNGTLRFNTTVPGTVVVKFSDTGTSASASAIKRYLVINGETTEYWTSRAKTGDGAYDAKLNVTSGAIVVPAGDVTISGTSAIVVYNVKFTPAYTRSVVSDNWGTICLPYAVAAGNFSGATFYSIIDKDETSVSLQSVSALEAGKPYIFQASSSTLTAYLDNNSNAAVAGIDNGLHGTLVNLDFATPFDVENTYIIYNNQVRKASALSGVDANRAYIEMDEITTRSLAPGRPIIMMPLEPSNATDIKAIEDSEKIVKFIENGKLFIMKDGIVFDALGRIVK